MSTPSPIGSLILDSEDRARKKASQTHTSTAKDCGCQVTTSWFGPGGRSTKIEACSEHTPSRK